MSEAYTFKISSDLLILMVLYYLDVIGLNYMFEKPSSSKLNSYLQKNMFMMLHKETNNFQNMEYMKFNEQIISFFVVNSVIFAPQEFGLVLACGSSDGSISIISSSGKTNFLQS